jgi:hypothetical protein
MKISSDWKAKTGKPYPGQLVTAQGDEFTNGGAFNPKIPAKNIPT